MDKQTRKTQMKQTIQAFKSRPKTTKMVAVETGIQRANITRYVATLEKYGSISVIEKAPCEITMHKAKYYSTNPRYTKSSSQYNLFPRRQKRAFSS